MLNISKVTKKIGLLLILLFPLSSHSASVKENDVIDQIIPEFENKVLKIMKSNGIPGVAIVIVAKDKVHYLETFGIKRVGQSDKITETTLFQAASLSKPINATLLAILQDKGKLSLEDPVNQYLPQFQVKNNNKPVKICHLMSHSSGVPKGGFNHLIETNMPRDDILIKLQKARAIAPPGKVFDYHNAMYGVIEDVVKNATGKPLEQVLKEELFIPLGMKHASVGIKPLLESDNKAYPHAFDRRGRYQPVESYSKGYYVFSAAGGVNVSIQDMASFLQLYLGSKSHVISKESLSKLTDPFVPNPKAVIVCEAKKGAIANTYYGLGWQSMTYKNTKIIYHQGHLKGFRNFMGYIKDDVGIVILTNAEKKHASKIALSFFELYLSNKG